jgi:hypothetical protein
LSFVEKNDGSVKSPDKTKWPYETPVLSEYGDIRQITQNTNSPQSRSDSSGHPHKTGA